MDASTVVHGKGPPEPGDFSLCMKCGAFLTYNEKLEIKLAGIDQLAKLLEESPAAFNTLIKAGRIIRETNQWN
jgi:hypothetical protein